MKTFEEIVLNWYNSRNEPYRIQGNRLTSRCIFHGGDNPTALILNLRTGNYKCWTRNCKHDPKKFFETSEDVVFETNIHVNQGIAESISVEYLESQILSEGYLRLYQQPFGIYMDYLKGRGFDEDDIFNYEILCCDDHLSADYQRIVIPVRDSKGRLRTFCNRHINPVGDTRKYIFYEKPRMNLFYQMQSWIPAKPLVLCEGIFDTISLLKHGVINATSPFSSQLSKHQISFINRPSFPGIIMAMDNPNIDEAGKNAIEKILFTMAKQMPEKKYGVMIPPEDCKDWNEAHVKGYDLYKIYNNSLNSMICGKDLVK